VLATSGTAGATGAEAGAKAVADAGDGEECPGPVLITRWFPGGSIERRWLTLVGCDGEPSPDALDELSLIARPAKLPRPEPEEIEDPPSGFVAPGIIRLHPGLLRRLQALASRFPGRRMVVVSGYRPDARPGSRHRHGRALDIRVGGTPRSEVSATARDLPDTGVGYYPNSVFTHIDVRERSAYWIDRSRPGEPPDYGPWPDPDWPGHRQPPADGPDGTAVAAVAAATTMNDAVDDPGDDRGAPAPGATKTTRRQDVPAAEGHDDALAEILAQIRHGLHLDEPDATPPGGLADPAGEAVLAIGTVEEDTGATAPEAPAAHDREPAPTTAGAPDTPSPPRDPPPPAAPPASADPPPAAYTGGTVLIAE